MGTISQQDFDTALDRLLSSKGSSGGDMMVALAAVFPDLRFDEFEGLMARAMARMQARIEAEERETAAMKTVLSVMGKVPETMTLRDAIDLRAADGDADAIALKAHFDSPAHRLQVALAEAAVAAHPDWSEDAEGGYRYLPDQGDDADELPEIPVEWFIDTHPDDATAIYETVYGHRPPAIPGKEG